MEATIFAGAFAATAVVFTLGVAPHAAATDTTQVVGIEESVGDPNGSEVAYTVTKILPSFDAVDYPAAGQLYEASVMARALRGTVVPVLPSFSARAESGVKYPALVGISGLSAAPLAEGATTDGKIYFDVVGDVPHSVVYDNGPESRLAWTQPVAGGSESGGSTGSTGGSGGSQGVMGSTGPNDASPQTSGGEAGNTGEGGTEGGGGNLDSGGGSGAPNGDTGGD